MSEDTLQRRMLRWLMIYVVVLTAVVGLGGKLLHERAEHAVWRSLLKTELNTFVQRREAEPDYVWQDSDTLSLYRLSNGTAPAALSGLAPGLHDDLVLANRKSVAFVRDTPKDGRVAMVLDVTDFEALERFAGVGTVLGALLLAVLTFLLASFAMRRAITPLTRLATDIAGLDPEARAGRVDAAPGATADMVVIADALNDYLRRNEQFVERERIFVGSASHELRTPVAVIAGASELALSHPDVPAPVREQVLRIQRTARGVEQLVSLLLVLVRDPQRLARESDQFNLDELLPAIVDDHRHLCLGKDLTMRLSAVVGVTLLAPMAIVRAAVGNLLRNAIENSDRGEIHIVLERSGLLSIEDPGHGMSPEEISAIYARMARRGGGEGGIGLDLIARLCEHLGWTLRFTSSGGDDAAHSALRSPAAATSSAPPTASDTRGEAPMHEAAAGAPSASQRTASELPSRRAARPRGTRVTLDFGGSRLA